MLQFCECECYIRFADSPRDSVQFIEWSPTSGPRALLIANFHGRITIWTQPSQVSRCCALLLSNYMRFSSQNLLFLVVYLLIIFKYWKIT